MSYPALVERLRSRLGLDPESIGLTALHHAIDEACAQLGGVDTSELLSRVDRDSREWQRFVDCMVVPETWLFRVPEQFDDLLRHVRSAVGERRPLRILSLPCASGEEVYSIAAALADAGYATTSFEVLGIDVSELAIDRARRAHYGKHALRGRTVDANWFQWQDAALQPAPALLRACQFRVGNILAADVFAENERFDIIFCRNLLIYLHSDARRAALDRLLTVLEPGGLILSGQAEVLSQMDPRLQPMPGYGPLCFVRSSARAPQQTAPDAQQAAPQRRRVAAVVAPARVRMAAPSDPVSAARPLPAPAGNPLADAQRAADRGHLKQARQQCQALLAEHPESAAAWFLLGMVEMADGALERADQAFTRTSYLDGHHYDALQHRAALAERLGRLDEAARLRSRLRRMAVEEGP